MRAPPKRDRNGTERWLGLLVRLFPASFREELGDEMRATLRAEHCEAAAASRRRELLGFWVRNIAGVLRAAPREHLEALAGDFRHASRTMARRPLFALTAAVSLAVGIAATTTVAAVASAAFLRELPAITSPEELVDVKPQLGDGSGLVSYPYFLDLERETASFCDLAGFSGQPFSLSTEASQEPVRVFGQVVTAGFFPLLGVQPRFGRFFTPTEDIDVGAHPVAVLSTWLWRERFGGDPGVLGQPIWLNGHQLTIVGVGPEGFRGHFIGFPLDVFVPASMAGLTGIEDRLDRDLRWVELIGRRREGVGVEVAQAGFAHAVATLAAAHPEVDPAAEIVVTARHPLEADLRGGAALLLGVLGAISLAVLAIACLNVANLSLTHLAARRGEMALRLALGASRGQIARLLATETFALVALAGGLGLLLAIWATRAAASAFTGLVDGEHLDIRLDLPALAIASVVCLLTAIVFGSGPVLRAARTDLAEVLRQGRPLGAPSRLWRGLVVVQVAFSVVVLVCGGLFVRVLERAGRLDPGFRVAGVLTAALDPSQMGLGSAEGRLLLARLLSRADELSGVTAALTDRVPLSLGARFFARPLHVAVHGVEPEPGRNGFAIEHSLVSAGYFDVLSIPIVAGRGFAVGDADLGRRLVVVNESFATRFFPDGAVGRTLTDTEGELQIIGVARDSRARRLDEPPAPFLYLALEQSSRAAATLLARSGAAVDDRRGALSPSDLRAALREEAPHLPVPAIRPLADIVSASLLPQRVAAKVTGVLGGVGLLLTAFGLYGLVAYTARRRAPEIGLRMSLGARPIDIQCMMLRQGLALTVVGVAVGWPLAYALAGLLSGFLVGLHPADAPTYLAIAMLLLSSAALACWLPARRGARVDPVAVLRRE